MDTRRIVIFKSSEHSLAKFEKNLSASYPSHSLILPNNNATNDPQAYESALSPPTLAILVEISEDYDYPAFLTRLRDASDKQASLILGVLKNTSDSSIHDLLTELPIDGFFFSSWPIERLISKLDQLAQLQSHNEALQTEIAGTSQAAMTAMKAASEVGLLMQLVEWLNDSTTIEEAGNALFRVCRSLEVNGFCLVQQNQKTVFLPSGLVHETAKKILTEARQSSIRVLSKNRIVVFRLDYLVLMVTNAPWEDEDKYGRLRDILLQASALTEARARTITVNELIIAQHSQVKNIMTLIKSVSSETQMYARNIMHNLSAELGEAAITLDLTEEQETKLQAMSERALDSIEVLYSGSDALESHFHTLVSSITEVKELTQLQKPEQPGNKASASPTDNDEITLF